MKRLTVESSQIKSIGYKPEGRILEIEFHRGGIYQYVPILETTYQELIASVSIGQYFNEKIKNNSTVTCEKIN